MDQTMAKPPADESDVIAEPLDASCASKWELITRCFQGIEGAELEKLVERCVDISSNERQKRRPHAYSDRQIQSLVFNILKVPQSTDLKRFHRYTDEFAVIVGSAIRLESTRRIGDRIRDVRSKFIKPATKLREALSQED